MLKKLLSILLILYQIVCKKKWDTRDCATLVLSDCWCSIRGQNLLMTSYLLTWTVIWASSRENLSLGSATRVYSNRPVQSQKLGWGLKFRSAGWSAPLLFAYCINRISYDVAHVETTRPWPKLQNVQTPQPVMLSSMNLFQGTFSCKHIRLRWYFYDRNKTYHYYTGHKAGIYIVYSKPKVTWQFLLLKISIPILIWSN